MKQLSQKKEHKDFQIEVSEGSQKWYFALNFDIKGESTCIYVSDVFDCNFDESKIISYIDENEILLKSICTKILLTQVKI